VASDLQSRRPFGVLWLLHVGGLSGRVRIGFQRGKPHPCVAVPRSQKLAIVGPGAGSCGCGRVVRQTPI
jgi:hypothetical protein